MLSKANDGLAELVGWVGGGSVGVAVLVGRVGLAALVGCAAGQVGFGIGGDWLGRVDQLRCLSTCPRRFDRVG